MSVLKSPSATAVRARPLADILSLVQPSLRALDEVLREQVAQFEPEVRDFAGYCLESTGKRLRPMLVFLSGWRGSAEPDPSLVRAAAVIEMTHLATLVHDDIMDHAALRRGKATVATRDGPTVAVLLGDALFAQSVWLSTQFPSVEVCRHVAAATRQVCTGEIIQTLGGPTAVPSRERYQRIIDLKTAELFQVSCRLGGLLAGYPAPYVDAVADFGRQLGIAYQVYDDLTDFAASTALAGKTLGTDWASGKLTLPLLILLERIPAADGERLLGLLRSGAVESFGEIARAMAGAGVFGAVAAEMRAQVASARARLQDWPDQPPTALLLELAAYLEGQLEKLPLGP